MIQKSLGCMRCMVWRSSHAGIIMSKPLSAATPVHDGNDLTSSTSRTSIMKRLCFCFKNSPFTKRCPNVPSTYCASVRPSSQFRYAETRHERSAYYIQYNRVSIVRITVPAPEHWASLPCETTRQRTQPDELPRMTERRACPAFRPVFRHLSVCSPFSWPRRCSQISYTYTPFQPSFLLSFISR